MQSSSNFSICSGGGIVRLIDWIYPIGSVISSVNGSFNPNKLYASQTWVRFAKGQTLVGVNESDADFSTVEKAGGEKKHTLSLAELPKNRASFLISNGSGNDYTDMGATAAVNYQSVSVMKGYVGYGFYYGNNEPHNNLQPYITVYYWKRTA